MEATRVRFGPILEWLCAAAVIVGAVAGVAVVIPHLHSVPAVTGTPVMAHEAPVPDPSPVVGPGAVAIPMLPLPSGGDLRVGDRASRVQAALGGIQQGTDALERDGARERITRFYDYAGAKLAIVLEAPRAGAEPLVLAIYRQ